MARHIRRAGIVSRLKALISVIEDFVRADSATLGKTGSGATWTDIRGAWAIASNKASTSTAGSSYPISVLTFTNEDVTLSVGGVGPGMGTAFWVTDSNNWWGAYIDGVQSCQTCTTPGNPATYTYNYVSGGNCSTYSTVPGNCTTYSTVNVNCATYSTVPGNCTTYSTVTPCATYNTVTNCTTYSTVNVNCSTYSTVPGNCSTYSTSCSYPCATYSTSCSYPCATYVRSYPCNAYNPPSYPCNANNAAAYPCTTYNAANCTTYNASTCSSYSVVNNWYNVQAGYACGGAGNSAPASSCGLTFAQAQACGGCKNLGFYNVPAQYTCATYNSPTCNAFNSPTCSAWSYTAPTCSTYSTVPGNCSTYSTVSNCSTYNTSCAYPCATWNTSCSYPCNATNATTYPCNAYNKAYPCNAYVSNYPCATYNTQYPCNATNATTYPCNVYNKAYPCNAYNPTTYPCTAYNPITYATVVASYNAATYYSCNCVTDNKINIVKMIAGTLTTVATLSFASAIASFKAILSGSTITIQAFTGTNYTTQIGTDQSTTVSGYTKTKKHGIMKGVVTYAPSDTSVIDEFRVS